MRFWDVIKEVSAQAVRKEAGRLFVLGIAGEAAQVERARQVLLGPDPSPEVAAGAGPFLVLGSPPYGPEVEGRLRHADVLVSLPGGPGLTDLRPAETLTVTTAEEIPAAVLAHRPDLRLALARRLPGFRPLAAEQVIRDVSRVNAEFAVVAGVSTSVPFLAPLFPAVAGTDILVLTKNQVLMIFRLAAVYGQDLDLKSRAREVLAVIGGAFGWRTLARQLAGLLPGGLGLPLRVSVAYTGTYAVGRAAQVVLDENRKPTRREMLRIYEEASRLARETLARLRSRSEGSGEDAPAPALPEGERAGEEQAARDEQRQDT